MFDNVDEDIRYELHDEIDEALDHVGYVVTTLLKGGGNEQYGW